MGAVPGVEGGVVGGGGALMHVQPGHVAGDGLSHTQVGLVAVGHATVGQGHALGPVRETSDDRRWLGGVPVASEHFPWRPHTVDVGRHAEQYVGHGFRRCVEVLVDVAHEDPALATHQRQDVLVQKGGLDAGRERAVVAEPGDAVGVVADAVERVVGIENRANKSQKRIGQTLANSF